jgi:hypothetical protein
LLLLETGLVLAGLMLGASAWKFIRRWNSL